MDPDLEENRAPEITQVLRLVSREWPGEIWKDVNLAVALSGGADSVAMLRVLKMIKEDVGGLGEIYAIHVNHKLRGDESEQDARWCLELCGKIGIQCFVLECDPSSRAAEDGDGLEAAARSERYALLASEAERLGARYLTTAHIRDDQVETILFRLLRGSGLKGLAGIPKSRALSPAVTVVRPLLNCSRTQLKEFLKAIGQTWRNDSTNETLQFTRNRIRHDLLPKLRDEYNSNLDSILLQLAAQSEEANQVIDQLAGELLDRSSIVQNQDSRNSLSIEFCEKTELHLPVVIAALRILWRDAGLPEQDMTYHWWHQLAEQVLNTELETVLNLPANIRASIRCKHLLLEWYSALLAMR